MKTYTYTHIYTGHADMVMAVHFSKDGKQLISGSWDGLFFNIFKNFLKYNFFKNFFFNKYYN